MSNVSFCHVCRFRNPSSASVGPLSLFSRGLATLKVAESGGPSAPDNRVGKCDKAYLRPAHPSATDIGRVSCPALLNRLIATD